MSRSCGSLVLALGFMAAVSCGGGASHPDKIEIEGGVTGGSIKIEGTTPQTWSATAPNGQCWKVTFKNAAGEVIGTECGTGAGAGQVPAGTAHTSFDGINCEDCGGDFEVEPWLEGSYPYEFLKGPNGFNVSTPYVATYIRAAALTYAGAQAKAAVVEQGGPGTELPGGVQVYSYVTVTYVSGDVVVASSLPERFGQFTITVNGTVVADKSTGTNVVVTGAGNGWATASSLLPGSLFQAGAVMVLQQSATGNTNPVTMSMTF